MQAYVRRPRIAAAPAASGGNVDNIPSISNIVGGNDFLNVRFKGFHTGERVCM